MVIKYASWIHGHNVHVSVLPGAEEPTPIDYTEDGAIIDLSNPPIPVPYRLHFAISTPVILSGKRLHVESVMLRFDAERVFVTNILVYDANNPLDVAGGSIRMTGNHPFERFKILDRDVPNPDVFRRAIPEVFFGIGISFSVIWDEDSFPPRKLKLYSAGADFYEDQFVDEPRDA